MSVAHYFLFLLIAAATILSPGPGVVLTLTNAVRYGLYQTLGSIVGIAAGALIVAALCATGVGLILATSAIAFALMKYAGAAYLFYMGLKLWRARPTEPGQSADTHSSWRIRFAEGLAVQVSNPKAIFFFMAVLPQFVDHDLRFSGQFFLLVASYGTLVLTIHLLYALSAEKARAWLSSARGTRLANRTSGATFMIFGSVLAVSHK